MENLADFLYKTTIVEQNYKFKWTINNLSKLNFGVNMKSGFFNASKDDSDWYATFIYDSNCPAKLQLTRKPSAVRVRISCGAKILDCNGKVYYEDRKGITHFFNPDNDSNLTFSEIKSTVLNDLKTAPDDTFDVIFMIKSFKFDKESDCNTISQQMCDEEAKNSFCTKFWKRFLNKIGTDVTLQVQGEKIEAHKTVLSAQSPVFTKMFEAPMSESQNNTVVIDDISLTTMTELVHFMYSKAGFGYSFVSALELYYAADKYEVFELRKICGKILLGLITVDNAGVLLELGDKHKDVKLKTDVMAFINFNFKSCIQKDWMLTLIRKQDDLVKEVLSNIK